MRIRTTRARRIGLLLPLLLLTAAPIAARAPESAGVPWLYKGSDVPQDKAWTFGVLPNGIRYAVRHNGVPPEQVSIRVLVDAGSMYETESQRGYAHLIEHLTFRESKYLKEGEAIPTWQRLGATFGSDTNAETSPTQTVYKLDIPNATDAKLDETFRLLSGMITAPIFTDHGVKTEVPIVLAEMRERTSPQSRVLDETRGLFFKGQLLASRNPIGTVQTLEAANAAAVKAFHDKWYRPDNTVIVVAGDADPAALVARIKQSFGGWKATGKKPLQPDFGKPLAPAGADPKNPVGEAKVLVEPDLPRIINWAILRPWVKVNDTIQYNQGLMIDRLALALINRRLEARARGGGSYLVASVDEMKQELSRSADATVVTVTPLGEDWKGAVKDVRAVIADALATPPSQEEIDREVAEFEVAFKVSVETQTTIAGSKAADDIVNAVDIRETVANPDTVYDIFKRSIPLFRPQAVLDHTRGLFKGTVVRPLMITPKAGEADEASLRAALTAPVDAASGSRVAANGLKFSDLPAVGVPGTVATARPIGLLGIEQIELSNGVKVLLWPNDAEPGRIIIKARFGGGYSAISPQDAVYGPLAEVALMDSGIGELGRDDLDRLATGRKLSLDFDIDDTAFVMSSDTRPADLQDQLYLMAAKLAMPRWDPNPVLRAKAAAKLQYESYNSAPMAVLNRDLTWLLRDGDPRYATPNPAELDRATPEGFRKTWEQLLAQGPIEIDMFGDFTREQALAALEKTFGALPARQPAPASTLAPSIPAHNAEPLVLTHRGDPSQAAAVVAWPTGGGQAGVRESRQLEILAQIFNNRLFDAMREKVGASYAPQVGSSWPLDLPSGGYIAATVQVRPGDFETFFAAADKIAADLVATPPTADEIARVTEPLKQLITRASTGNGFYMFQLEGAANDPRKIAAIRTILNDYSQTTPERMQALAERYLRKDKSWRLEVVPEKAGQATP
ncbi:peptidase M16-like protein [Novosphingobium aromaticivorans DSM 12444]|uniref:Peptidase M16-like protein n=1 Tax=Novosphingobium aromaticivorans (strain ATCC 700278 / DSM 12444 / CCUG 56034 / CIP 105152 / NBRC 16084 / F199) TaxID=279238 RepID=Q2G9N8_NOVAD|nr:M16 family metallopeptidase [Novosphingobium aromaticivorans]ABD25435.1 peptidase M16-like protein [Novosphingobium aromaticivorans DSM 12444]SCX93513.1 zinc protease [Novosphingobium aromaticivorans]